MKTIPQQLTEFREICCQHIAKLQSGKPITPVDRAAIKRVDKALAGIRKQIREGDVQRPNDAG
jgi:hypothetical protein